MNKYIPIVDKQLIEDNIERVTESGCWIWMGPLSSKGRPYMSIQGSKYLMHRVSYAVNASTFDVGLNTNHTCDNILCVNPHHLYVGTQQDNVADRVERGRGADISGEYDPNSKLSKRAITDILLRLGQGELPSSVQNTYNQVSVGTIRNLRQKGWEAIR